MVYLVYPPRGSQSASSNGASDQVYSDDEKNSRVLGRRLIEQSFSYQITVDDTAEESKNCKRKKVTTETENYCKPETETILVGETYSC